MAFSLNNVGSDNLSGGTKQTAGADTQTNAAGFVSFQSTHFFSVPDRVFDFDINGAIGFRPTLALLSPQTTDGTQQLIAQYQPAFARAIWAEPNFRFADLAELTPILGLGQTILTTLQSLVQSGTNSVVAINGTNGASKSAIFGEPGVKLGIFSQSFDILHLIKGLSRAYLRLGYWLEKGQSVYE